MIRTVEFIQDALAESFNECFDVALIQDSLRKSLLELYGKLSQSDREQLFERYQTLIDATIAQNVKKDRFLDADEVKAIQEFVH